MAQDLLKTGQPEGTLVITNHQTAGRGQRGNRWESQPGENLTFSVILNPSFLNVKDQFYLTIVTSLSLCDYLFERLKERPQIKWPNDIMVNDRKTCGILIENSLSGETIQTSILGIGLNVNQVVFTVPRATSMRLVSGREYDLNTELGHLLGHLEKRYLQLRAGNTRDLRDAYLRNLYWLKEPHRFESGAEKFSGSIEGVDHQGRLLVTTGTKLLAFDVKEIRFID